jgi:hypothetical protein
MATDTTRSNTVRARERDEDVNTANATSWIIASIVVVALILGALYLLPRLSGSNAGGTASPATPATQNSLTPGANERGAGSPAQEASPRTTNPTTPSGAPGSGGVQ